MNDYYFLHRCSNIISFSPPQECSEETSSLDSQQVAGGHVDEVQATPTTGRKKGGRMRHQKSMDEWEILEGLRNDQKCENKPIKHDGYLLKRRKWPMKGWHKVICIFVNQSAAAFT